MTDNKFTHHQDKAESSRITSYDTTPSHHCDNDYEVKDFSKEDFLYNRLLNEHKELDKEIDKKLKSNNVSTMELMRLKKRKLQLKDKMRRLKDNINPDIIA